MVKLVSILTLTVLILNFFASSCFATYDPLSKKNNIVGIHILFTDEISQAKDLVNSNGGDWGYVTIPIQSGDKNIEKWQKFMDDARQLHIIPILRLATNGDYFNTKVWEKPKYADITDFANFLDSLVWPTKNRYVVVYNEVNRADEWGDSVAPNEYAQLLSFAADTFHAKNSDFFVISAGLDNAAPNKTGEFMNEFSFMRAMNNEVPGVFSEVDGLASHSYPNPGFSQPPQSINMYSFRQERILAKLLSDKSLPVFITETGWSKDVLSEFQISLYFKESLETVWKDENIIAITPFLLRATAGPFEKFSFISNDGSHSLMYKTVESFQKVKGEPDITLVPYLTEIKPMSLPTKDFSYTNKLEEGLQKIKDVGKIFKFLLHL